MLDLVFEFYLSQIVLFFFYLWAGMLLHSAVFVSPEPRSFPGFGSPSLLPLTVMFTMTEGHNG